MHCRSTCSGFKSLFACLFQKVQIQLKLNWNNPETFKFQNNSLKYLETKMDNGVQGMNGGYPGGGGQYGGLESTNGGAEENARQERC